MPFKIKTINGSSNPFALYTEELTIPDPGGANESEISSSVINVGLPIFHKFLVQLEVTETSTSNGSADIQVEGSIDKDHWEPLDLPLGLGTDTTAQGSSYAFADLTGHNTPYYRLRIFTDGTDTGGSVGVTLSFAIQPLITERA